MNTIRNWLVAIVGIAACCGFCGDIYITDVVYGDGTLTLNSSDVRRKGHAEGTCCAAPLRALGFPLVRGGGRAVVELGACG